MSEDPMSEEYDPDKALEAYGYGKSGTGKNILIVILILLLVVSAGAAVYVARLWSAEQSASLALRQQMDAVTQQISSLENKNAELSSLLADKQAETDRMREEWAAQVENLKERQQEQLERTYAQMNEIVYDSKTTLSYIGDIESRLRDGQKIDETEAARLKSVVNGLVFLHEQYKKPLNEFRELNRYFTQQLALLPDETEDPKETKPLAYRIFQNRKFKEERDQFLQSEGKRSALTEAKEAVDKAYASAQRQMSSVSLDINQYLAELEAVVESNEASAESVTQFFAKSKEILKIHDRIMNIEPPKTETVRP